MLAALVLSGCLAALWLSVRGLLSGQLAHTQERLGSIENQRKEIGRAHASLEKENVAIRKGLDEIIVLYEITKEIAKSMDEEKIFSSFRQKIDQYIELQDCRFLKEPVDPQRYPGSLLLPLRLDHKTVGWLIADGVRPNEQEKFHILAEQFLLSVKRAILYERLQELSITDTLTSVFTRRHYLERVQEEVGFSEKNDSPFAFLMLDIDHFKEFNDHYGHLVGDAILREVAKVMKENLRQIDLIGRYGGEEFSIMLTQTGKEGAWFAAQRIRQSLEKREIRVYDEKLRVTISIGIAVFPEDASGLKELVERADAALYRAKEEGRNKVCGWEGN